MNFLKFLWHALPFVAPSPATVPATKELSPEQILLNRTAYVLERDGWTQCRLHDTEGRHCIAGAIVLADRELRGKMRVETFERAVLRLSKHINQVPVTVWNDYVCKSQAEAVYVLRKAALN